MTPTTVAAFKRAMAPGTRVRIDNKVRPQANREATVGDTRSDFVTISEQAPQGSHTQWPKKGQVVTDGAGTWGLLDDSTAKVWLAITVLDA